MFEIDLLLHLRGFVAVAEARSFSRAAEDLAVAQPLLSRRIKSLEVEVGEPLFDRSRRQIELTAAGRALVGPAQDLLARADLFEQSVRAAAGSSVIRLGVPLDLDPRSIARIVASSVELGQVVDVIQLPPEERRAGVDDGSLTAALVRVPPESAGFSVPLGFASAGRTFTVSSRRAHLEDLRPRRGASGGRRRMLVSSEDDAPEFMAALARSAAHAGLTNGQITTMHLSQALVAVLASEDVLVSSRQFARTQSLNWAQFDDPSLQRGYRLQVDRAAAHSAEIGHFIDELTPLLVRATGAPGSGPSTAPPTQPQSILQGTI